MNKYGGVKMNDILDFPAEDLILKLPINRLVKMNLDYGSEKESMSTKIKNTLLRYLQVTND